MRAAWNELPNPRAKSLDLRIFKTRFCPPPEPELTLHDEIQSAAEILDKRVFNVSAAGFDHICIQ
jgi:hypothetical protein